MSMPRPLDLHRLQLSVGAHDPGSEEMCVMEAVAYMEGEPWSDHPQCVSPVIAEFCRSWNDSLNDADRNRLLKPIIMETIGTRTTDEDEETRAWLATDWLARVQAPAWLRLAGLEDHARALEGLARIVDAVTARSAQPTLEAVREASAAASAAASDAASAAARDAASAAASAAARDAASDAAWSAAWSAASDAASAAASAAARDAASDAAWSAAWSAASDAARDAAWSAARDAARDAAWSAAWSAARSAAWSAAWSAASDAARAAARDAAWSAATDRLAPTVAQLQESALDLLHRMCAVGREEVANG